MPVIPDGPTLEVGAVTTRAELPPDGELALGPVRLPAGRGRVLEALAPEPAAPVAWLTDEPVPEPGRVWRELSQACACTGLVPFVAAAMERRENRDRPWGSGELDEPQDAALADDLDPGQLLRQQWEERWPVSGDSEELEWAEERTAPFGREFPGLAPFITERLDPARLAGALRRLRRPERIGLVPAARPADVLPAIGWIPANWTDWTMPVTAILRSWEDRFGARLVQVENGAITLLVERPPRDQAAAQRIAAELFLFADEIHLRRRWALTTVSEITPRLVDTPMWRCWWD
ncbi:MAG TPA: DUF4253 domain-containing protein [Streptosporangiaceae bacterium]|jgi:hypothetical protein|nr:DUF4253 domain-containing protein [Streptosporangiaceae bacterium]